MRLGALEAGGTKMVCAVGDETGRVIERESFATLTPDETLPRIIEYFSGKGIEALGVGSFGPLCLDPAAENFGDITTSSKLQWIDVPLYRQLKHALNVPMGIDTDVNAAALGEARLGAGKGLDSLVYFTVGTGVGGGALVEGRLLHGMVHPEMGHILLRPHPADPAPKGFCPYHEGCAEGLASGPAMEKRWGMPAKDLPDDHIGWEIEADYLAQVCVTAVVVLSPKRIVLGGGVMHHMALFDRVRALTTQKLNKYVAHANINENIDGYIVPPALGDNAGAAGSLLLAVDALKRGN